MSTALSRYAAALVFLSSAALVASDLGLDAYGVTSDEQGYFDAAAAHVRWIPMVLSRQAYSPEVLRKHFAVKPEIVVHPNLSRWLGGASWAVWHGLLRRDQVIGFRLAQAFVFGLLCAVLFLAAKSWWGPSAGLLAVGLTWTSGRLFGHAHVLATDLPLATLWVSTALLVVARRPLDRRAGIALGVILGAALATKLTAVLLCAGALSYLALRDGRRAASSLVIASAVAALVVLALHPGGWIDPLESLTRPFSDFQARKDWVFVPTLYFGTVYEHRVPISAPTVHLLVTFPTVHVILAVLGLLAALRVFRRSLAASGPPASQVSLLLADSRVFLAGIALVPLAAASVPAAPAHDLERLTLPIQPFLILLATFGTATFARGLSHRLSFHWSDSLVAGALACAVLSAAAIGAFRVHPYELASFNAFIGGPVGAHATGFDVAYSKTELNGRALAALQRFLTPGERLYADFPYRDLLEHQKNGRLPRDFIIVERPPDADWAVLIGRRSWMTSFERVLYAETSPVWALRTHDGVTLVGLYRLPGAVARPSKLREG